MIYIKKGSQILKVSKGSYEDTFKKLGYEIINKSEEVAQKTTSSEKINNISEKEEKKLIEEEKNSNNNKQEEDRITSDNLKVNIIGENVNFGEIDNKQTKNEESALEKALKAKKNK